MFDIFLYEVGIKLFHTKMTRKKRLTKLMTVVTSGGEEGKGICFLFTITTYGLNFYEYKFYNLKSKKFSCI